VAIPIHEKKILRVQVRQRDNLSNVIVFAASVVITVSARHLHSHVTANGAKLANKRMIELNCIVNDIEVLDRVGTKVCRPKYKVSCSAGDQSGHGPPINTAGFLPETRV
jgi:hypothetical protein